MALPKILTVDTNNIIIINEALLVIPEYRQLWDENKDIKVFYYLWAMYDPESPYFNLSDEDRQEGVLKDYPIQEYMNELSFIQAINKTEQLYFSPIRKILKGTKAAVEKLALFFETEEVTSGRDGSVNSIISGIKTMPQIIKAYLEAENQYKIEVSKSRGNTQFGIDELD